MKTRADLRDYRRTNERKVYFTEDLTAEGEIVLSDTQNQTERVHCWLLDV